MTKFLMAIYFVAFLLFAGSMAKTVYSMDIGEIEAISQTSDATKHIDNGAFYNSFATGETTLSSLSQPFFAMARIQRAMSLQVSLFFKNVFQCISKIDSAFTLHKGRIYDTTFNNFISQPFCKYYYVFALRHIII